MAVNHENNYTSDGQITGTLSTKYRCSICGHRTDAAILNNTTSLKRYAENFTNMPLNRDLYNRFNDPDYILKRDYYKYYFFKPTQSGNRLIQTFSTQSTKITFFDIDKKRFYQLLALADTIITHSLIIILKVGKCIILELTYFL